MEERRKNLRVTFRASCDVIPSAEGIEPLMALPTQDISLKGLFVMSEEKLPVGTPCTVRLHLEGTSSILALEVQAVVRRTDPRGMGLSFEKIDMDSFFHLKNILYYNSGDPERIVSEIVSS